MSDYSTEIAFSSNGHSQNGHPNEAGEFVAYARNPNRPPQFKTLQLQDAAQSLYENYQVAGLEGVRAAMNQIIRFLEPDFPAVAQALNAPRRLVHETELDTLPPTSYLIPGEIPNGLTILFGASGSYKSFRALDYAEIIAQTAPVIYIAAEGAAGYDKRAKAWHKHHKAGRGGLYFWLDAIAMLDAQAVEAFTVAALEIRPRLIVIDTLARCMLGGDENSAKDMGLFIDACNRIQRELNTAVLVVHHTGKGNGSERGSSALRGAADSMIEITADDGGIRVSCSKSKDSKPFETYYLKPVEIEVTPGESSIVLLPSDRVIDDTEALTQTQRAIVEWLATEVFDQGARANDLMTATNIPKSSFYSVVKSLSRRGIIEKAGKYDPWILTETGKELAMKYGYAGSPAKSNGSPKTTPNLH